MIMSRIGYRIVIAVAYFCAMLRSIAATVVTHDLLGCAIVSKATCPDSQNIKFHLFTRLHPSVPENITMSPDNLLTTTFNAANPTKIIVHGYNANYTEPYNIEIKDQYLIKGDHNVIMVDWSTLCAGARCYLASLSNVDHVAECVAGLIQRLRSATTDIHVIGHSLGAQLVGVTANFLKPFHLPIITGLDPAGPLFGNSANKDKKLDSSDAIFVEVYHTNIFQYGTDKQCGHVDYYFNGGFTQPGCGLPIVTLSCSHERALSYYAETINTHIGFYGSQCSSLAQYLSGECPEKPKKKLVGDDSNRGIISVFTRSESPYALGK